MKTLKFKQKTKTFFYRFAHISGYSIEHIDYNDGTDPRIHFNIAMLGSYTIVIAPETPEERDELIKIFEAYEAYVEARSL